MRAPINPWQPQRRHAQPETVSGLAKRCKRDGKRRDCRHLGRAMADSQRHSAFMRREGGA
jgi:hypothetical protein